ncbi:MAG: ATP-binding protein [Mariprofundaceae bacterium]
MFFSIRRLLHSLAYFLASLIVLGLFIIVLMLAESIIYTLTKQPVSMWAMVIAALAAAFFFSPVLIKLQRLIDLLIFHRQIDTLAAIQQLGAGDLAELPQEHVEQALLERIASICHRGSAALDERTSSDQGLLFCFPKHAPEPPMQGASSIHYELVLPIERQNSVAWLYLSPRLDGWPTDEKERHSLERLARFAAMSLEHARLSHQQSQHVRLDSITRVTSQLHSHDMKNRLHDLAFLAHHMESGKLDMDDLKLLVPSIRKVVGRMQTLMQRMSDPNAPIHPKFKACDLTGLLRQQLKDRLWPELLHVHADFKDMPPISGDILLLQGVFENLFDNAVQAMSYQGNLYITTQIEENKLHIAVRDEGDGMTQGFMKQRLFRLFATSKAEGLGIGLYLSKRIIEAHCGTLSAQSEGEGKGSTFSVCLPLCQDLSSPPQGEST